MTDPFTDYDNLTMGVSKDVRKLAITFMEALDKSPKTFVQAMLVAEGMVYNQKELDDLWDKFVHEPNLKGMLHPQLAQWIEEVRSKTLENKENREDCL